MPRNRLSQSLTSAYKQRLDSFRVRLERSAVGGWPTLDGLGGSDWVERTAGEVEQAQIGALRATAGYLTAFLSSELGYRVAGPTIESATYAGVGADGQGLIEGLQSPIIGIRAKLKEGVSPAKALAFGRDRAKRQVGMDFDAAHRKALIDTIDVDERFDGWRRVTTGTCGACLALSGRLEYGITFSVHPGCKCVSQPRVSGVPDLFPVPTGTELFDSKSEVEQDDALGPKAAALVRAGVIELQDLVEHEQLDSDQPAFITQKPVDRLIATN